MWTRPAIECLLNELRKRKCLYDQRHIDYLNRAKRRQCLEAICKVLLDKEELEATVDDVKGKIQVLRSQLNKELRYMARSKKFKPKLWCFKKMEFLKPYCAHRTMTPFVPTNTITTTNDQPKRKTRKNSIDQNSSKSTSPFEADVPSSSNILTSKATETETNDECNYADINQQFYDMIALTQQIVQTRMAAKLQKPKESSMKESSWEAELVRNQLDLITDKTIRSDTMWEIQCVLRRGIEHDRVLPKDPRRNRRSSEVSAVGSCISLDSNDSTCKATTNPAQEKSNISID